MKLEDNPFIKPENFFEGYNQSIEDFKNRPELVSFDKICHDLFTSDVGKKFMEYVHENFLIPPMADRYGRNFKEMIIWGEGFKDAFRTLKMHVRSHAQRIQAEGKQ